MAMVTLTPRSGRQATRSLASLLQIFQVSLESPRGQRVFLLLSGHAGVVDGYPHCGAKGAAVERDGLNQRRPAILTDNGPRVGAGEREQGVVVDALEEFGQRGRPLTHVGGGSS